MRAAQVVPFKKWAFLAAMAVGGLTAAGRGGEAAPAGGGMPALEPVDPALAYAYDFDRVRLHDGGAFWGKVQTPVTARGWEVLLEDPATDDPDERARQRNTRITTVAVGRVRDIEWSVVRRLEMLRDDLRRGRLDNAGFRLAQRDLARLCEERRALRPEYATLARRLYLQLVGTTGAPDDVHLRLARLFDEQDPADDETRRHALAQYEAHLRLFPDDAEAKAAAARLAALLAPPAAGEAGAAGSARKAEGMENSRRWAWMLDGVSPTAEQRQALEPALVTNALDNGNILLKLPYMPLPGKDKVIYEIASSVQRDYTPDKALALTAFLQPEMLSGVQIAVALQTGNYEWHESVPKPLPASTGWTAREMRFNLHDPTWKTSATEWQHRVPVANLNQVRKVFVLVINRNNQDKGAVFLDDMRFE